VPQVDPTSHQEKGLPFNLRSCALGTALFAIGAGIMPSAAAAQAPMQDVQFHITAQSLSGALHEFAAQSGIHVRLDEALVQNQTSSGLEGRYSPDEALQKLLAAAGLMAVHIDATSVAVQHEALRDIGSVTAPVHSNYIVTDPGLGKYTKPLLDTPQTITAVSSQVLKDQNATTLHDALRNVSGISLAAGEGGSQGDSLTIRGFDAKDDFYLDGMRDFGNYYRDPFNLDHVEVIMGPSTMLLGHGQGGGIVNQVSKAPENYNENELTVSAGTDGTTRAVIDSNHAFNEHTAVRVNAMTDYSGVAGRAITNTKRWGFAPSVTFGLGTSTRTTLSLYTQSDNGVPDYGFPYVNDRPATVNRSNFYGFANYDHLRDGITIMTARVDHDYSPELTLHSQTRYATYERSFVADNATAPTPQPAPGTAQSAVTVPRAQHARDGHETFLTNQTYFINHVKTGKIAHTLLYGADVSRETSQETSFRATGIPSTNLANPTPNQPFSATTLLASSSNHVTADTLGIYFADSVDLTEKWNLNGGLRFDSFGTQNNETVGGTSAQQNVKKLSPQGSIVYKPQKNGSIYLSYNNSFQPSADALSLTSAQVVAPADTSTVELGSKWDLAHKKINVTASVFNSILNDAHINQPDGTVLPVGKERINGFQTQVQGNISRRFHVTGGYTLLESRVLSYALSTQPTATGSSVPNAPTGSATFWSTYELPRMEFGLGATGVSQRQASIGVDVNTGQPILVPGYIRVDGSAKYRLNKRASLQLNAYNLLDKYYYDELHPDHVVPGAGRTVLASYNLKF
jgi:catecholate siderophore receptor